MKSFLKFLIYLLLIAAFGYAIYNNQHQLTEIAGILQEGVWYLVLTTILLLGLVIYNQAALYTSIYEVFELPGERRHLLNLYLVARFIIVAAPSGGVSGWVPFIQDARVRRLPLGPVLVANLIYYILWYSNFAIFLLIGLLLLLLAHDLEWFEVAAATVLLLTDLVMIIGLILVGIAPALLQRILDRVQRILARVSGWVKRPPPINPNQIHRLVRDLHEAVNQMRQVGTRTLLRPVQYALSNELLNLLILYLLGRAFSLNLAISVLIVGYSVSVLFYIVSPTPGGLGFVEGALILVLTSLGVPQAGATVVTLAYRGITFWLPFLLGFVALRRVKRFNDGLRR